MSIGVMTWVWTHSRSRNGARLVLLAIADAASDDGTNAWPSVRTLKTKANLSERSVQSAIKELEKLGELKVGWNEGPKGSNRYTVVMATPAESAPPQNLHPADIAGVENGPDSGAIPQDPPQNLHPAESAPPQILQGTPAESAPEPSMNHPSSSTKKIPAQRRKSDPPPTPEHPRFAEFWPAYPRREGKGKAREAFAKAIDSGASPEAIVAAAGRCARHHARVKTDTKYIPLPATWLNQERWDDEYGDEPRGDNTQPEPPPHCGVCDPADRTIELHDGSIVRCPDCHPDAERNRK